MSAVALLLADSRFPAGGYAHSLGLEQAVGDGLGIDGVAPFMSARLRLVARADAALSVAARRAAAATATATEELARLDEEHAARCPNPVLRETARRLGAQLLRSAATAWPGATIEDYRATSCTTPRPIALGVVGAAAGIDDHEVATIALYDDAATVSSAALKLLGLDPAEAARWVADLTAEIDSVAGAVVADVRPIFEQPPPAAVGIELAATVHAARNERFFAS
jgi:urease accessory protein